jgi:hypothetical protein
MTEEWEIVDRLHRQGYWLKLTSPFFPGDKWNAGFTEHHFTGWNGRPQYKGQGDTPLEAIRDTAAAVQIEAPIKE